MISLKIKKRLHGAEDEIHLDIDTFVNDGEMLTITGPSGSGKTSVLRMVAGLMNPESGSVVVGKETWFDSSGKINIKPQNRSIGMVFQEYSLFPNMSVRENLEFALEKNQNKNIIDELLGIMELTNLDNKKPGLLSGGQKQRVALARSLVRRPKLLLLDEPLSALNTDLRAKIQDYILMIHEQFSLTTLLVSHDIPEIMKMSKRVIVIENGVVKKDCHPSALINT
jgi:molybdate transport system ATP-binding protein